MQAMNPSQVAPQGFPQWLSRSSNIVLIFALILGRVWASDSTKQFWLTYKCQNIQFSRATCSSPVFVCARSDSFLSRDPLGVVLPKLWVKEPWQRLSNFTPSGGNGYSAREFVARTYGIHRQLSPVMAAMMDQRAHKSKQCFSSSAILSSRHLRSLCTTEQRKHVSQLTVLTAKHHCLRGTGRWCDEEVISDHKAAGRHAGPWTHQSTLNIHEFSHFWHSRVFFFSTLLFFCFSYTSFLFVS